MAIIGALGTVRAQLARNRWFDTAMDYLEDCLRPGTTAHTRVAGVPVGETNRVELGGEMFAMEQAYLTKPREQGRLESHRKYIDIQVIFAGSELMEHVAIGWLKVAEDLTPGKDVIFYQDNRTTSVLRLDGAGATAVFYPVDGHMGGIALGSPALVRKIVVKVPVVEKA